MKPTYTRRARRRSAATTEAAAFRKEAQKENTFFGGPSHETFFQPAMAIQRKCEKCEEEEKQVKRTPEKKEEEEKKVQRMAEKKEEEEKKVQRMEEKKEDEKKLNRKEAAAQSTAGMATGAYLSSLQNKGQALPAPAQQFFGARMGHDFSHVKVHTGAEAAHSAKDINAQAYTYKNHIVFNEGKYNTESAEGKKLLAHELTHVIQQGRADLQDTPAIARSVSIGSPYPVAEDFEPSRLYQRRLAAMGFTQALINAVSVKPSDGSGKFNNALRRPVLNQRDLDSISRPDLSDSSLDTVRNNLAELKFGSFGKNVQLIQEALIAWGKGLDEPVDMLPKFGADKNFKSETKGAVESFQSEHPSLGTPDGIVGDHTLAELQREMDKLHGSIFSIDNVPNNDFRGVIHTPPPSAKWLTITVDAQSFVNHPLIPPGDRNAIISHLATCKAQQVILSFRDLGGAVQGILTHERVHEKDQLKTVNNHLVPWDRDLQLTQLLNVKWRAANAQDGERQLYIMLSIPDPAQLSKNIVDEWGTDNQNFHQSAAGGGVPTSSILPDCAHVIITFSS